MRHYTGNVPKNELRECQIGGGTRFRGTIPGPVFWLRENPVIDNWEIADDPSIENSTYKFPLHTKGTGLHDQYYGDSGTPTDCYHADGAAI